MFATFTAPNVAVVGSYDRTEDPDNSDILNDAARVLAGQKTPHGDMKVVRIPMPPHADGIWRSYTNVIFANGVLLVPQYPDVSPELDKKALEVYAGLLPDWKIVGIDARTLITKRGALHCVSINVPALP
jgi:agmatine/peptidylarginine deiminase